MTDVFVRGVRAAAESPCVPWDAFCDCSLVLSGATGLIGRTLVQVLLERNRTHAAGIGLSLLVRDPKKARGLFGESEELAVVPWDALSPDVPHVDSADYVVHAAAVTASKLMVERPVETIDTAICGARSLLELSRKHNARFCFLSSMEVYGSGREEPLDESCGGALDAMNVRSSYPQSKQLVETLCAAFAAEYGVHASVARLAQTFGAGIPADDGRVFAHLARSVREGRRIELATDGSKRNMYVATPDAITALLCILARGEAGLAYNVANPATFCSVYEMACMVARTFGSGVEVARNCDPGAARAYAVAGTLRLDTARIRSLGWEPTRDIADMYRDMMGDWECA